jgi:ABC-2 type transport system ATP-binding protein
VIKVQNLHKSYGKFKALKNISFSASHGKILGLLGPNGAGKTTTMRILTGFLRPSSGEVLINHLNIAENTKSIQQQIGYLPENAPLYHDLTAYEHLEFIAEIHKIIQTEKKQAIQKIAETCGLTDRLHFNVSELSKGYRQRLGLAQALIHDPEILILDEPTTGLDPNQIAEIRELIKKLGQEKIVILSTHIMQEVEAICDRVVIINQGKIVKKGTLEEITQHQHATHITHVSVKSTTKKVQTVLEKIKDVKEIHKIVGLAPRTCAFSVSSDKDLRGEISQAIIKAGLELLEISSEKQTMEDVFKELTK